MELGSSESITCKSTYEESLHIGTRSTDAAGQDAKENLSLCRSRLVVLSEEKSVMFLIQIRKSTYLS